MNSRTLLTFFTFVSILLVHIPMSAQAATGGDILRLPLLPRAIAIGNAYAAQTQDVNSLLYNPAGLSTIRNTQLAFVHSIGLIDNVEYVALAKSMKIGGALGANLIIRQLPAIDNDGAIDDPVNSQDILATVGYARGFKEAEKGAENISVGANVKWLKSTLGNFAATTLAADLGAWWQPLALPELQVGLALRNLGMPIKYESVADDLPMCVLAGAAYKVFQNSINSVSVLADVNVPMATELLQVNAGAEYWFNSLIAARIGYEYQQDSLASGIQGGLGVKTMLGSVQLCVDYAFKPVAFSESHNTAEHSVSMTLGF